ncbi:hypothetical protein [Burkholderia lata]|uniref:Uncharacterized protein n=1 Tax=Burkholderia lata (strain ATCC 17760 / DSM 23089 / LMG 22485 / NCIMB 9086 / R18194 / 383) TaxID=482957 RepID=A0A6P2SHE2_BURL3|nr:hypothetical protein [Burkholderia lata]VWC48535.1 hypothetical protein BLA6863_07632 [Burkholderia lata]
MVRLIGCGVLALTFASTGWAAEHYVEVWNPPEARHPAAHAPDARTPDARTPAPAAHTGADAHAGKSAEKHANATPKAAVKPHKRRVAQAVKAGSHRPPAAETPAAPRPVAQPAPGRLTVMQPAAPDAQHALNYSNIPRQYTPDGNVLQVGTHGRSAEVTR